MVVLEVPQNDVTLYFTTTSITAPILGAVLSGVIGSKIGGHDSRYAVPSCMFAAAFCTLCGILFPFSNDFRAAIGLIWFMLFFGGYILPFVTGIMLAHVEQDLKAKANSLANFSYFMFGYTPAPTIYGAVCSLTGGKKSRWGMISLLYTIIPAVILLIILQLTKKPETKKCKQQSQTEQLLGDPKKKVSKIRSFNYDISHMGNGLGMGIPISVVEPEHSPKRRKAST